MNGLGNKMSAQDERAMTDAAIENFDKRIKETGLIPGTHTLGREFATVEKVAEKK